jgi:hypothetical protein
MSTLHTPGPWRRMGHRTIAAGTGPDMRTICELGSWWGDYSETDGNAALIEAVTVFEVFSGCVGVDQADGNEALIEATPDL